MLKISSLFKYILSLAICAVLTTTSVLPCAAMTKTGGMKVYCDNETGNGEEPKDPESQKVEDVVKSVYMTDEVVEIVPDEYANNSFYSIYPQLSGAKTRLYLVPVYDESTGKMVSFLSVMEAERDGLYYMAALSSSPDDKKYDGVASTVIAEQTGNKTQWMKSGSLDTDIPGTFTEYGYKNESTGKTGITTIMSENNNNWINLPKAYTSYIRDKNGNITKMAAGLESYYGGAKKLVYNADGTCEYKDNGGSIVTPFGMAQYIIGNDAYGRQKFSRPSDDNKQYIIKDANTPSEVLGIPTMADFEYMTEYLISAITHEKITVIDPKTGEKTVVDKSYVPTSEDLIRFSDGKYNAKQFFSGKDGGDAAIEKALMAYVDRYYGKTIGNGIRGKFAEKTLGIVKNNTKKYNKWQQMYYIEELQ